ncbi:MAG: zinc ribbon domain-containing protein [Coriobacteriales bacterium]|jgi:predicted  nucleic acid-binding Zn-ribbon protein
MSEAEALVKLQDIDLEKLRLKKKLEDMPQAATLEKIENKIEEVTGKSRQISAMRSSCEVEMQKLADEDENLIGRADELQGNVEATSDFRAIDRYSKELEGIAKRRNKVEFEHDKLVERANKISSVEEQVADAMSKLEAQKEKYQKQIDEIKEEVESGIEKLDAEYDDMKSKVSQGVLEKYEHIRDAKNGIAVGVLQGSHCSVCRVEFPEGKLMQLHSGPTITTCPQCHRILIVEK